MRFEQNYLDQFSKMLSPLLFFDLIKVTLSDEAALCITTNETEYWLHDIFANTLLYLQTDYFIYAVSNIRQIHIENSKSARQYLFAHDYDEHLSSFSINLNVNIKKYIHSQIVCELKPQKRTQGFWGTTIKEVNSREYILKAAQDALTDIHDLKTLIQLHQELYGMLWKKLKKQQRKQRERITLSRIMHNLSLQERADDAKTQVPIVASAAHTQMEDTILKSLGPLVLHYIVRLQIAEDHNHFIISTIYQPMLTAMQHLFKLEQDAHTLTYETSTNALGTLHHLRFDGYDTEFFSAFNQQEAAKKPNERRILMLARSSFMDIIREHSAHKNHQIASNSFKLQKGASEEVRISQAQDIDSCVSLFTRYIQICKRPSQQDLASITLKSSLDCKNY